VTTVALSADPILRFTDNQGNPLAGGTLLTQVGGVNFPTYSDSAGTIQLPNPIVLNSRGEVATAVGVSTPLFLTANTTYAFTVSDANGNVIYPAVPVVAPQSSQATLNALTRAAIGVQLFPLTAAEVAAGVTPTDYGIPSHLTAGVVLPERYGGAGDNSTLNDTPHANSMKVANAVGDAVVQYGSGAATIWKFNDPITVGATNQGRRVVGLGRVEFNFRAGISSALDLVTVSANLLSLQQDQPQFDNIQIQANGGGRDGLVLTVGNRPLIRNVRIMNTGRDGFVESVTGTNWIEKAEVSVLVRFAGRHGWRQESSARQARTRSSTREPTSSRCAACRRSPPAVLLARSPAPQAWVLRPRSATTSQRRYSTRSTTRPRQFLPRVPWCSIPSWCRTTC
jgi:hypothetical protein